MFEIPFINPEANWSDVFLALEPQPIHVVSWKAFPYRPAAHFKIAHNGDFIFLEYVIVEKQLKAVYRHTNDPVYKDSCVEFFIAFDRIHYYNLEFNSLGTALIGYGTAEKDKRYRLPNALIETIESICVFDTVASAQPGISWKLQLKIPRGVFLESNIGSFSGHRAWANFYKCGDDLDDPHFVSWKQIKTAEPNFHQPLYFGEIAFDKPIG